MNYLNNVLDDFIDGNHQQRLDLYMCNRNLRSDFDQIENEETTLQKSELIDSQQVVIKPAKTLGQQSFIIRMKRWCFSILS